MQTLLSRQWIHAAGDAIDVRVDWINVLRAMHRCIARNWSIRPWNAPAHCAELIDQWSAMHALIRRMHRWGAQHGSVLCAVMTRGVRGATRGRGDVMDAFAGVLRAIVAGMRCRIGTVP